MAADVTVAVPVYDGARYLDEVLAAVRAQRTDREVELLVFDSGSTDGSLEIAERHGARIHRIAKAEFSHGGTRNRMVATAEGEHVAFLTQDATPAHDGWLAALLEGFEQADDVALVFGPHEPRPGASHMIKVEMERHFAVWERLDVQRLPDDLAAYRHFPGRYTFFSDVNGCVARWAWQRIPYRAVPYAEDQLLGREMIEAGLAKVFHPGARVLHSHDYPPAQFLRRYFDEFRSLREVLDHVEPAHPLNTPRTVRSLARNDERWLREHGVEGRELRRAVAVSYRHHAIRQAGAIVGTRADRLPRPLRRILSLDGRDSFTPYDVPESPLLSTAPTQPDSRPVGYKAHTEYEFIADAYPPRPLAVEPHSGDATGPWTIAWVVPVWKRGSGGHTTVFRLVRQMELRGHRCVIFVFDPQRARADVRRRAARRDPRALRPRRRGRGLQGARRLRLRRRLHRHRLADRVPGPRPPALPREGLPGPGPRARVLRHVRAVGLGRGDVPDGLPQHRLHAVDGGRCCATATGSTPAGSSAAPTSTSSRSPGRRAASARSSPCTRAARPSAAPSSWRCRRWRCW